MTVKGRKRRTPPAAAVRDEQAAPALPVFRCTLCGNGANMVAYTHAVVYAPVGADGIIADYEWTNDEDDVIEESVACRVHGDGLHIEKLVNGEYTTAMINGRFVPPAVELATNLLDSPDVKYDPEHCELRDLAWRVAGRDCQRPARPEDIARFHELAEARAQQRGEKRSAP